MPFRWLSRRWSRQGKHPQPQGHQDGVQTAQFLGAAPRPLPRLPWVLDPHLIWYQVEQVASFWEQPETTVGVKNLWQATHRFVQGLQKQSFAFLLKHQGGQLRAGWVCESRSPIKGPLEASYPGLITTSCTGGVAALLASSPPYQAAIQVQGNPASPTPNEPGWDTFEHLGLDTLVQGLVSSNWLYVVLAWPTDHMRHRALLQQVYNREAELRAAYLRQGTALERNNPQAQAWLKQVEAEKSRMEEGLRTGLWDSVAVLYLERVEALGVAASLLRNLFAGPDSQPQSLFLSWYLANLPGSGSPGNFSPSLLNARDLARLILIPKQSYQGYPVRPYSTFDRHQPQAKRGRQIFLGNLAAAPQAPVFLEQGDLPKHLLIAGTTGSGKTNACLSLLYQSWKLHQIPFMVLETSEKSEYGEKLKNLLGNELDVYTLGDESRRPLHLNILQVPPGISVEAHMGHLRNIFKAAFTLPPPTPHLLDEALHFWYRRCGWDVERNIPPATGGPPLVFADLIGILEELLSSKYQRYDKELRGNIEGALLARLSALTRGSVGKFFVSHPGELTPWENLLKKPVILELANITEREQKALALLYILYLIRSSAREEQKRQPDRLHLTVVEEAHQVLAQQEVTKHPEVADASGAAMQAFAEALRLLREFREGFIILDQMPSHLSPAVRANTNMKLAFRLPEEEEQRVIAQAAGLDEGQKKLLYRLPPGEALWFSATGGVYHVTIPKFPPQ